MDGLIFDLTAAQKDQVKTLLKSPHTFATTLMAILLDQHGTEAMDWEPETIEKQMKYDWGNDLAPVNLDKLNALRLALTTNQFYLSWEIFNTTCQALNDVEPSFEQFSPADPAEMAWGVSEILLNDPPSKENGTDLFSDDVARFAGAVLYQNGIFQPPKILSFAELPVKDPVTDLETAFSDDASMFEASMQSQSEKKKEVEDYVSSRYNAMMTEMAAVPLKHRGTSKQTAEKKVPLEGLPKPKMGIMK